MHACLMVSVLWSLGSACGQKIWYHDRTNELDSSIPYSPVAMSPNGTLVVFGSTDDMIKLVDARTGAVLRTWTGHSSDVKSVGFSPDGNTVVSGSDGIKLQELHPGYANPKF